uniref:Uncharacterized protein n=1 Tax=Anopheles farauti TaxID=69004 RepID=A0A182QU47_9DIPT
MDRNMGRQGPMSMSPGMMRRPGGGGGGRDMHPQNHSSYQTQQNLVSATAGAMLNNGGGNGPPPPSSAPSSSMSSPSSSSSSSVASSTMHQVHPLQQQQQSHPQQPLHQQQQSAQIQHSQHDELIRYINEAWNSVSGNATERGNCCSALGNSNAALMACQRLSLSCSNRLMAPFSITTDKGQKAPVFYKSVPEPRLSGFTPFDLERWWGQRMMHHLNIGSHGHQ